MENYQSTLNRIAFNQIKKNVDIPDYHLMIGTAEELASQPIMLSENIIPKHVYNALPNIDNMTYEEVQQNLSSGKLTIDDFFQNVYPMGDAIIKS